MNVAAPSWVSWWPVNRTWRSMRSNVSYTQQYRRRYHEPGIIDVINECYTIEMTIPLQVSTGVLIPVTGTLSQGRL